MVLIFRRNMRKRCENRYAKFGGAARRRFPAICEKPEGGRKTAPPARRGVSVLYGRVLLKSKILPRFCIKNAYINLFSVTEN